MGIQAALLFALMAGQEDLPRLLEKLADNDPVVRDQAATTLVEGYSTFRKPLEEELSRATEPDLKERLREVLSEGHRNEIRRAFERALPGRISREFPAFAGALHHRDPRIRAAAFRSLEQTHGVTIQNCSFPGLFLTPGEMAGLLTHLQAAIDPSPESDPVRFEWVGVLFAHEGLLDRSDWADAARGLFRDPSPVVRSHAVQNLASRVARPADLAEISLRWPELDPNERWRVLQEVSVRKLEALYPLFEKELADPKRGVHAANIILRQRIDPLRSRALLVLRERPRDAVFTDAFQGTTPEEATPILLAALPESGGWTSYALNAIGKYGGPAAGDAVAAFLNSGDSGVRGAALQALESTGAPRHARAVARALRECYETGKDADFPSGTAWRLLVRFGAGEDIAGLLDLLPKMNPYTTDFPGALRSLKPAGVGEKLAPFLRSDDLYTAGRAIELLAAAGDVKAARANLDAFRSLFGKKDAPLGVLFQAAGELGLRELIPLVLDRLEPWILDW